MNQTITPSALSAASPGILTPKSSLRFWRNFMVSSMLLFASLLPNLSKAQTSLTIGTGTSSSSLYPIYTCYGYNYSQQTFLASEIVAAGASSGVPGYISSVSFYLNSVSASSFSTYCKDWVVYMGNTTKSTFSSTSDWVAFSSLTKVYDGTVTPTGTGWFKITFSTSFYWDGTSNIVLAIDENTPSYYCTASWRGTSRSGTRGLLYYSDGTNPSPSSPPTANSTTSTIANIQVDYTPAVPCSGTTVGGSTAASSTSLCPGGSVGLSVTGATVGTGMTWQWESATASTGPWSTISGATSTNLTIAPPSGTTTYYRRQTTCTSTSSSAYSTGVAVAVSSSMSVPYSENFEAGSVGVNVPCATASPSFSSSTTYYGTDYWKIISDVTVPYAASSRPGGSKYLVAGYYIGTYTGAGADYWFTPGINLSSGKTYRFSYWHRMSDYSASSYAGGVDIGMYYSSVASKSSTTLTAIKPDLLSRSNNTYQQNVGDFSVASSGVYYLAVKANNKTFGGYYCAASFDDLNLIELPACSTATASTFGRGGTVSATPNVLCGVPGTTALSVSGSPAFSGLSFQWSVATGSPTTFTDIVGATSAAYSYPISSGGNYYFRCLVTCAATGLNSYSDTTLVKTTPITPPYIEDFETAPIPNNVPCAGFTYSWGSPGYYWSTASAGSPGASVVNHTVGGSKVLLAGTYLGTYGSSADQWWFTPGLALTAGKAYDVSFWFRSAAYTSSYYSYPYKVGIGVGGSQTALAMANLGDTTCTGTGTISSWFQFKRGFVATATATQYVGIKINHSQFTYYGTNIDDIGVEQLPPCSAKPTAGTAMASPSTLCTSTATSLISLTGLSAASDLQFQWQESMTGAPGTFTDISGATTPGYTTTTPATAKWYRCIVTCPLISAPNVDTSAAVFVKTIPITPPYYEDFETGVSGVNMPCAGYTTSWGATTYWFLRDGDFSSSYPAIKNHTPGGSKYIHAGYALGSYSSGKTEYWFTPALALTASKAYNVSYWFNGSGYSGGNTLTGVAAGTAQSIAAMTIPAGADTIVNISTYRQINRAFIAPTTGNYYVGIKVNNLVYSYPGVAIDDIGVTQLPPCSAKPTAGTATCTPTMVCTTGSVLLGLVGTSYASDLTFQWYNVTTGTPVIIAGATSATYSTPTLSATQKYICVVKCPLISAPNTDTSSIITVNVGAIIPPYKETFESGTIGTNLPCASYTSSWGSPGTYWTLGGAPFSSSYPAIKNNTPGGSKYLHAGYYIGTYGSGAVQYWFTPRIQFTAGATYEMSYWYNGSGYAGGNVNLGMYYGTAQTAAAMTTAIIPDLTGINTSTYKQLTGRFIAPSTAGYFIGIRVNNSTYNYPGVAIDDIGLDQLPPCSGVPTAGAVTAPSMLCSPGTVAVNMDYAGVTKASGLSYRWEWSTSSTFATISGSSAALTGPSYTSPTISSTTYFRCIVKCTLTGDSTFSSVLKVDVGAIVPPYVEDFEKATPGVNVPCASYSTSPYWGQYYYWNTMSSPMTYGTSPLDNHTVGGSKYLIGGYYIGYSSYSGYSEDFWLSPAVTLTAGKRYQVSYWYNTDGYTGANYKCGVYMGTTQTKAGMTTLLGSILNPSNTTYKEFKHQFVASASGNVYFGIMKGSAGFGYGMSFDDIGLREVPPCSSSVVAGTIFSDPEHICSAGGTTTLDLSGSTLATGLTYEWLSSTTAAGPYTSTGGTTLPYNTDPLFAATWFKCVVKCSATGVADTSAAFRVGVGGFDLPYIEDFEKRADFPLCSDATAKGMYYYDAWKVYVGTYTGAYTNHTPGGNKHLVAGYYLGYSTYSPSYPTVTDDNYWFTPGLNLRAGYKYNLSFWYIGTGGGSYSIGNRMGVYYGRTQSVGGMTNVIAPFKVRTNSSYEQLDTNFTVSTSAVYYLGFRKSNNIAMGSSYALQAYGVAFDDINLNYAPCAGTPFAGTISSAKPSGTAYCAYTPITLTDIGATISLVPGIKYQWYRRSSGSTGAWSTVVGAKDTVLSADTLIGYDYRLAVICSNTNDTVYTSLFQVPALPPHPAVTISPTTTPVTYCLGDSIKFTATSFTGALYDWMLDSAIVPGWKFNDYGATEPGTVMVRVTSALSACPAWSNQVKMIVNDPGYSVSITKPSDSIICAGTSMLLSATSSKAGVTYQWRKNNVDIPGATSSTYLVTTGGAYRVMAHDGLSSCKAASRNITITVKPNPPAVLSLPGGTATACENEGVQLNANTGGFSYEWTRGGSTIFGWKDSAVIVKNSGVYAVKVRSSDGCVSTSSSITVNILPSPIPVITKSGLTLGTVGTYASYQWIRNGVDIAGSTSSTHSLVYKGYYKVRVKDGNGCEGESNPIEITDAGLQDNPTSIGTIGMVNDQIKLYPNPTMAKVYIESPIAVKVSVKDVTGKTVYESRETKEVDLSKYADGVYLFTISDKEGNELIKQQRVTKFSK